jgi:hypothetical protein
MVKAGEFAVNYETADDGSKLTWKQKEDMKFLYIKQVEEQLAQLNQDAYTRYATRKIARDNRDNEELQNFMLWDENKNLYKFSSRVTKELQKMTRFKNAMDEGNVPGAMAVYSPLVKSFNKWDNKEKSAFIGMLTNTFNYIDTIN